jgi:hypothetical protein
VAPEQTDIFASAASAASERDAIGTALFVGGPWDGQLRPAFANEPETYRVLDGYGALPAALLDASPELLTMQCKVVDYRRVEFHTPSRDFVFWVLPEIAAEDLMARLIVAYHQHKDCA